MESYCQEKEWTLYWKNLNDDKYDSTSDILREYGIDKGSFDVLLFYSPKDLRVAFGTKNLESYFKEGKITQKRRIAGNYRNDELKYRICDLKGWSNKSLKEFAASVGVEMRSKDAMDFYKSHMLDGLIAEPENFLEYMVEDTKKLFDIREKFTGHIQCLQRDVIKLPESEIYDLKTIPMTIGAIVAGTFENYIRQYLYLKNNENDIKSLAYDYALKKLGILKTGIKNKEYLTNLYHESRQKIKDIDTFEKNTDGIEELIKYSKYQFEAFSQCSVKYFGLDTKTTAAFLALVQGGRCNNEQYWRYRLDYAADIDLKSAYASVLRKIEYPIGLPTITSFTPNETLPTLENWFKDTEVLKHPQNRNWMIVVEGDLTFSQDLLYSKKTTGNKINKAIISASEDDIRDDDSDSHIPGDFILARKGLRNAVITADLWEALRKVAKPSEYKELKNLKVVAAAYYREQDKCTDVDEWINKVLADDGSYRTDQRTGNIIDDRTRAWFVLPLEEIFGRIIEDREKYKKARDRAKEEGRQEDYLKLNGMQEALKLFSNTGYGVLASPYFIIGNTVVANNITAAIRLGVWQMSKALNTCQSITDGGMYEPNKVNKLKNNLKSSKRPCLETLSNLQKLQEHRSISVRSLGNQNFNWEELLERMFLKELTTEDELILEKHDKIALDHIKDFWSVYDLDFHFKVEHKEENYALRVAYWSKADYALDRLDSERFYKIRGAKNNKDKNLKKHPKFQLFNYILEEKDIFPEDLTYIFICLLKIGKFKVIQNSKGYEEHRDLQPGDDFIEERTAQFNNTHMPVDTIEVYEKRDKRSKKKDSELFERYATKGIKCVHVKMIQDDLRGHINK